MLLSITLDTRTDGPADARRAIETIAGTFDLNRFFNDSCSDVPAVDPSIVPAVDPSIVPAVDPSIVPAVDPSIVAALARTEVDTDGLPHDKRIHASTRARTQDGRWRRRSGVPDAEFNRVIAELRAIMADVPPPPPLASDVPPPPPLASDVPPPLPLASDVPPPPPLAPVAPSPYAQFMKWLASHMASADPAHRLAGTDWEPIVRNYGVTDSAGVGSLSLLQHRPDLLPAIRADIEAVLHAKAVTS